VIVASAIKTENLSLVETRICVSHTFCPKHVKSDA
jgi:hypothetical protein